MFGSILPLFFFDRLVEKINISIGQDLNSKSIIGVLDIYGFESFKCNRYSITSFLYHWNKKFNFL